MSQQREVNIKYRDVRIAYEVDEKSVAELAEQYQIDWVDMKKALMDYGITVRKNEKRPEEPNKAYKVVLVDTAKIVPETAKTKVVTAND